MSCRKDRRSCKICRMAGPIAIRCGSKGHGGVMGKKWHTTVCFWMSVVIGSTVASSCSSVHQSQGVGECYTLNKKLQVSYM